MQPSKVAQFRSTPACKQLGDNMCQRVPCTACTAFAAHEQALAALRCNLRVAPGDLTPLAADARSQGRRGRQRDADVHKVISSGTTRMLVRDRTRRMVRLRPNASRLIAPCRASSDIQRMSE
jgi:hypothetical protein